MIVGGGAAGLCAALVLGRARRRVAVIDGGQPRNAAAANMHGFLSPDGMPAAELLAAGRAEVTGYGVQFLDDRVLDVGPGFTITLARGRTLTARRILIATGVSDELPDIDGVRVEQGSAALPVLPRMGSSRATARSARQRPRLSATRPTRPSMVRRRARAPSVPNAGGGLPRAHGDS